MENKIPTEFNKNIILTNTCNGNCSYCFASDAMYGDGRDGLEKEFSLDNLSKLLDFLYDNDPTQSIRLLGWEPTRHSELEEVLKRILQKGFQEIIIFSNGIIDEKTRNTLKKYLKHTSFIWNINPPKTYTKNVWNTIQKSIKELSGENSHLGCNISSIDYHLGFIHDLLMQNSNIRRIRIGITHPIGTLNANQQKDIIYIKDYPRVGTIIYDFVKRIVADTRFKKIDYIGVDCWAAPCLWSREQRKFLESIPFFIQTGCASRTVITSDLRIQPCFTTVSKQDFSFRLRDFSDTLSLNNQRLAQDALANRYLPLISSNCESCEDIAHCSLGCAGERMMLARLQRIRCDFQLRGNTLSSQEKINTLLKKGRLLVACHEYSAAIECFREAVTLLQNSPNPEIEKSIRDILKEISLVLKK